MCPWKLITLSRINWFYYTFQQKVSSNENANIFFNNIQSKDISSTEMENPENVFNKGRWTLWALEVEQAPSCLSAQIPATNQPTHQLKNNIRNHLLVAPKLLNYSRPWNLKLFFLPQSRRNSNILPTDYYKIRSPS